MSKSQYAILRFAKYKGPEIGNIEAHNERSKEKYASKMSSLKHDLQVAAAIILLIRLTLTA